MTDFMQFCPHERKKKIRWIDWFGVSFFQLSVKIKRVFLINSKAFGLTIFILIIMTGRWELG